MPLVELVEGRVFRLIRISARFPPESDKPRVDDFEPSSADKARAATKGISVLVSVFDCDRTTVAEGRVIRGPSPEGYLAFKIDIADIRNKRIPGSRDYLRIYEDPLDPPESNMPGADGHCGIDGLERPPQAQRQAFKNLRAALCDCADPYDDGT